MSYYICFSLDDLYNLDISVECKLAEAKKWPYYIEVEPPAICEKKGVCLGKVSIKGDSE